MGTTLEKAKAIFDEVREIRRDIHAHPELGSQEFRTAEVIKTKLEEYGVDKIEQLTPTSVVALIHGTKSSNDVPKCIALRTDIDALPVQEDTNLPYSSENDGVMHACGHDMHCAMMLGNAKLLCEMRDEFAGSVKLIFQHSEDTQPGGSRDLVDQGVMDGVDAILGMHVFPQEKPSDFGKICVKKGSMTSSADLVEVTITGVGGHSSSPEKLNDTVLAASQMVVLLQQLQARYSDANDTIILPISYIRGDSAINIIPSKVELGGVARAYTNEMREVAEVQVKKVAKAVEELSGCRVDAKYTRGYSPVVNDDELTDMCVETIREELGHDSVQFMTQPMGFSEDFSAYAEMSGKPCTFLMLTAGNDCGYAPLHNAKSTLNENAMPYGMATMVSSALRFLNS